AAGGDVDLAGALERDGPAPGVVGAGAAAEGAGGAGRGRRRRGGGGPGSGAGGGGQQRHGNAGQAAAEGDEGGGARRGPADHAAHVVDGRQGVQGGRDLGGGGVVGEVGGGLSVEGEVECPAGAGDGELLDLGGRGVDQQGLGRHVDGSARGRAGGGGVAVQ